MIRGPGGTLASAAASPATLEATGRNGAIALSGLVLGGLLTSSILPTLLERIKALVPVGKVARRMWHRRTAVSWLTYRNIWFASQIIYSVGLFATILSDTYIVMVLVTGLVGFSLAVTQWIPFTLTNLAIKKIGGHSVLEAEGNSGMVATILGIHNTFIAAPQIIASLACTMVFTIVDGQAANEFLYGTSWIFAGCGLVSLIAAVLVLRIPDVCT
jgi:solute carrier family 45, member 1/2/4